VHTWLRSSLARERETTAFSSGHSCQSTLGPQSQRTPLRRKSRLSTEMSDWGPDHPIRCLRVRLVEHSIGVKQSVLNSVPADQSTRQIAGIQEGNRRLARRPPIGESSNVIVPS